ncbi:MAG: putative protein kinase, partial [Streblomastix strix]
HQILEGLAYLHDHKIVHRDIKSANCLVAGEGIVKLADFGCSKTIETVMSSGQGCATLCGTPHYMAPEVIRQQRNVGRRSDIWSLGCTVIEMITGKPPYADIKNATACIFKIASKELQAMLKVTNKKWSKMDKLFQTGLELISLFTKTGL